MESMKLVQAITGSGAAASFVHANTYADTRGEIFGVLTGLSTLLALLSLIVTVTIYVSIGLLEHDDMEAVEGYLSNYWLTLAGVIGGTLMSMVCLVAAVIVDAFNTYRTSSACILLFFFVAGLLGISTFAVTSARYVFTSGAECSERDGGSGRVSSSRPATGKGKQESESHQPQIRAAFLR